MLKRWRSLPQAGVGLLGLALALAFTLNADASSAREGTRTFKQPTVLFGGPADDAGAVSSPAITPLPVVQEFSLAGSGIVTTGVSVPESLCSAVGLTCNPADNCQCVKVTGNVTDGIGPVFSGPFTFWLNIDSSHLYNDGNNVNAPPGPGGVCFFASGVLFVNPAPSATLSFDTSGAACNGIEHASGLYSGGFNIGPSTAGFSNAVGSGMIGFGFNNVTKVGVFDLKGAGANIN